MLFLNIGINTYFHLYIDAAVGIIVIHGQLPTEPYPHSCYSIDVLIIVRVFDSLYIHIYIYIVFFAEGKRYTPSLLRA